MKLIQRSCADDRTLYVCLPGVRLLFYEGRYVGWYKPGKKPRRK